MPLTEHKNGTMIEAVFTGIINSLEEVVGLNDKINYWTKVFVVFPERKYYQQFKEFIAFT